MKSLLITGLALTMSVWGQSINQGSGYAPGDGTSRHGKPGTFTTPTAELGKAAPKTTGAGTNINGPGTMGTTAQSSITVEGSNTDPTRTETQELERENTSPNPISKDTTLQGKNQPGPYKTITPKQLQEEEIDYRAIPQVDRTDVDAPEDQ